MPSITSAPDFRLFPRNGPRDIGYWRVQLARAVEQVRVLRSVVAHGMVETSLEELQWRRKFHRKACEEWQKAKRARRSAEHRILMLEGTKIPYYRERILALTPTWLERVTGEDVL